MKNYLILLLLTIILFGCPNREEGIFLSANIDNLGLTCDLEREVGYLFETGLPVEILSVTLYNINADGDIEELGDLPDITGSVVELTAPGELIIGYDLSPADQLVFDVYEDQVNAINIEVKVTSPAIDPTRDYTINIFSDLAGDFDGLLEISSREESATINIEVENALQVTGC